MFNYYVMKYLETLLKLKVILFYVFSLLLK